MQLWEQDIAMPRVLYIEDNRENRMLVRRVLMASDYDFVVQEAETALRGIEMAQAEPPDIILMDLSMPEMDGLTATQHIRTIPQLSTIPIVALTANAMQGDRERSLSAGCDGYISKPIDVDKLPDDVFAFVGVIHIEPPPSTQPAEPTQAATIDPIPASVLQAVDPVIPSAPAAETVGLPLTLLPAAALVPAAENGSSHTIIEPVSASAPAPVESVSPAAPSIHSSDELREQDAP